MVSTATDPSRWALTFIGLGWALAFFATLAAQDFHPVFRTGYINLPTIIPWPILLVLVAAGFVLMVRGFKRLPPRPEQDVTPREAVLWLVVILGAAAYLRLYHFNQPPGKYWDDWGNSVNIGRQMMDDGRLFLMCPFGGREPFYFYVLTGLWILAPESLGFAIQRFASTLIDLVGLWVLYRAGKELAGRRVGLLAAAALAVSIPVAQLCVTGMRAGSVTFAVSLQVLTLLRLFRKPTLTSFLFWAFSTALGTYTYSTFRPFMMIVPFLLLFWIFKEPKERRLDLSALLLIGGALFSLWAVYDEMFIAIHPAFATLGSVWRQWGAQKILVVIVFLALIAFSTLLVVRTRRSGLGHRLACWALSVYLTGLAVYPLSRYDSFVARLPALSVLRSDHFEQNGLAFLLFKLLNMFKSLFYISPNRNDLTIGSEPFFGLFSQAVLFLGLAWFLAKPDWKKTFLLAMAFIGAVVRLLSFDPASTKLVSTLPALLLLSGWGLSRLWVRIPAGSWRSKTLIGFMTLFWAWGGWVSHQKIYRYWADVTSPDITVYQHVKKYSSDRRVYLAPSAWFYGHGTQVILNQGQRYYYLKSANSIPVLPGETPQDSLVLVQETNQPVIKLLKQQFPSAEWSETNIYDIEEHMKSQPNPELYMWRVWIPGASIPADQKALLFREEQAGPWLCRHYEGGIGWASGGVLREERLQTLSGTITIDESDQALFRKFGFYPKMVAVSGTLEVPESGDYEFSVLPNNPVWFRVDGRTVLKTRKVEEQPEVESLWLEKGSHRLDARVRFWRGSQMPLFRYRPAESDEEWTNL